MLGKAIQVHNPLFTKNPKQTNKSQKQPINSEIPNTFSKLVSKVNLALEQYLEYL
jgi:hypothetical protein